MVFVPVFLNLVLLNLGIFFFVCFWGFRGLPIVFGSFWVIFSHTENPFNLGNRAYIV